MKKSLDSNMIKIIAIIAMSIDHITWMIYPGYPKEIIPIILHIIGRITCPIMCYFIAEGYYYTKNINKYTKRLFVFAFISHFAYVFASMDFVDWKSFIPFYYGSVLKQTSIVALRGGQPIGMPYCGGYACGYALIGHYLKKTGASIYEATITPTVEILKQTEDFWQ